MIDWVPELIKNALIIRNKAIKVNSNSNLHMIAQRHFEVQYDSDSSVLIQILLSLN